TYRRHLIKAERTFGDMPVVALDDPGVRRDLKSYHTETAKRSGAREADIRLAVISAMLSWAVEAGWLKSDNILGFRPLYHADRSELIWSAEHIAAFMAVARIEMQRAMILALHTGQRQGDILRLTWTAYDGQYIRLRQGKARRRGVAGPLITIPVTAAL